MNAFLCIDDTDNLDSIGTGEVLQNLSVYLAEKELCTAGFVTRHQLFLHEDIAYTSHNSSMCTSIETKRKNIPEIVRLSGRYLEENCAEGSDPGLCIMLYEDLMSTGELLEYGKKAKTEVLQKKDAYDLAAKYPGIIFLSEHGGTGDGIIGALAGCALRIGGSDGGIKGKIKPADPEKIMKIRDFLSEYGLEGACDNEMVDVSLDDDMVCGEGTKAILKNNRPYLVVIRDEKNRAKWRAMERKEIKEAGIGR